MRVSSVEVMGLLRNHASLRRLQLFSYESVGVYAMMLISFREAKKKEAADSCRLPLVEGCGG